MVFLDPTNDITFRKIFGDETRHESLISLINAVLKLTGPRQVVSVTIASPYQLPRLKTLKETIVDVRAVDGQGREFIVEMQCRGGLNWTRRAVFSTCKAYVNQLQTGDEYGLLHPVYFIGVLKFKVPWDRIQKDSEIRLFGNSVLENAPGEEPPHDGAAHVNARPPVPERHWLTRHVLTNEVTHEQTSQDLSLTFLELPRFDKALSDCTSVVEKWAWFFKHGAEQTEVPASLQSEPAFAHAFASAHRLQWTEEELEDYEKHRHHLSLAKLEMAEAREEGRNEGRDEGRLSACRGICRTMHGAGLEHALIASMTGLTLQEVHQLLSTDAGVE
jgi:PD-(D/E)XK nuclease family transposase